MTRRKGPTRPRKTVFIHIPKTAGTMVRHVLFSKFRSVGMTYPSPPFKRVQDMTAEELDHFLSHEILVGHMELHGFLQLCDAPRVYTIMRNPVDRIISYYNHAHAHFPRYLERPVSLLKFLELPPHAQIRNFQLRLLRERPLGEPVSGHDLEVLLEQIEAGKIKVGIQERMADTFRFLDILAGTEPLGGETRINRSLGGLTRNSVTDYEIEEIRKRNRLDFRLYDYCLQRLNKFTANEAPAEPVA